MRTSLSHRGIALISFRTDGMRRTASFGLLLLVVSSCEPPERSSARLPGADTVEIDYDRCIVPPVTTADPRLIAASCAERFAVRNGYTDLRPVTDSSQWVLESMDFSGIEHRRNELRRRPFRVCSGDEGDDEGFGVLFWYGNDALPPEAMQGTGDIEAPDPDPTIDSHVRYARVLEMRSDFSGLRFVHQDVGPVGEAPAECLSLVSSSDPRP